MTHPDPARGRLLVSGANGFLGRLLLQRLVGARPLRAAVRSEGAAATLQALGLGDALEIARVDYTDNASLAAACTGCTQAVHFVGILKQDSRSRYADAHEDSARALATVAASQGLDRIVYPSILGARPDHPNECLASKGRAEQILLGAPTPCIVLRVPMVLGVGDFASRALARRARSRVVFLARGGRSLEQPIDADDLITAIVSALERPGIAPLALDLAGPESLRQRELVARAARALAVRGPLVVPLPLALIRCFAFLCERLLANPPLTRAMLGVLDHDDCIDPRLACTKLGLELTPLDRTLRRCLGITR